MQKLLSYFETKPKNLFLVDGMGAALSGVLQLVVFTLVERNNSVPLGFEIVLIGIPFLFVLVDIIFFFIKTKEVSRFIYLITLLNTLFVIYSLSFIMMFFNELNVLTSVYLVVELMIVLSLVVFELILAKKLLTT